MTAYEFDQSFAKRVKDERRITNEILHDILRAEGEKFHLQLGFSSLFDWLTTGHGYSGSAAQRRIQAARLLKVVPDLSEKLESGSTNLSVAAKAQAAFVQKEKLGLAISDGEKAEVIAELEGKSTFQAEQKLMEMFPELEHVPMKDARVVVAKNRTRVSADFSEEAMQVLERVKELLSHQYPEGSMNDIWLHVGNYFLKKEDPLHKEVRVRRSQKVEKLQACHSNSREVVRAQQSKNLQEARAQKAAQTSDLHQDSLNSTAAAANRCVKNEKAIPRPTQRITIRESDDRCEYCDPKTGRRCNSRYQTQTDHIHMRVFGGSNERQNLRRYCRSHNILISEQKLGRRWANHWRRKSSAPSR